MIEFKPPYNFKQGALLLIDKPKDWTSFDVVKKVKFSIGEKVGHAGTLDPLATGLLILATGKFTKRLTELTHLGKTYTGIIKMGATTPSFDRETEEENIRDCGHISEEMILNAARKFDGDIWQLPPMFSAVKRKGKRLYKYARKGEEVEIAPRNVLIDHFTIESVNGALIEFEIKCSKGTYIRSIANDLGKELGVGAYLHDLRRTAIGKFSVQDAWQLPNLIDHIKQQKVYESDH